MASSDLVWQVLRNNSSFLVKRDGLALSSEPMNLMNKHSYKYSGLANKKAVGVEIAGDAARSTVTLTVKAKGKRAPAKSVGKLSLKKDFRRVAKAITAATQGGQYRADLTAAALARLTKLSASVKPKKSAPKTGRRSRK